MYAIEDIGNANKISQSQATTPADTTWMLEHFQTEHSLNRKVQLSDCVHIGAPESHECNGNGAAPTSPNMTPHAEYMGLSDCVSRSISERSVDLSNLQENITRT
ncbi:hypothetical protein BOTNAR_0099g00140 [Botryotinia narcissicola]|uniref:Uncharacterized protein n=1 Tax=Botryotinia narcissicola TaxID=278944 RepID=A0A4Z1J3P1_9HELO|nr:hypothetical protein BOTNAR_0099g00140 [Botryotinia narcissicola]